MRKGSTFWLHKRKMRQISLVIIFGFIFNIVTMSFPVQSLLNHYIGISSAAAVADRDGLEFESFWNYFSNDLGGECKYAVNTFNMSESRIMILTKLKAGTFMTIIHIWKRMVWNCIGPVKSSYIENTKKNYHYTIRMWPWPWYFPKYR